VLLECVCDLLPSNGYTRYNTFSKIPPSTSIHFATRVRTWRVARLYSEVALSRKPFGIVHMYIHTFFLEWPEY
jgi:hypothetical protein